MSQRLARRARGNGLACMAMVLALGLAECLAAVAWFVFEAVAQYHSTGINGVAIQSGVCLVGLPPGLLLIVAIMGDFETLGLLLLPALVTIELCGLLGLFVSAVF